MQPIQVEADIFSAVGIVVGTFLAGLLLSWLFMRRRVVRRSPIINPPPEDLCYVIMSDVKHFLGNTADVIKGNLISLGEDLPTNPQRWKVARDIIYENALNIESMENRLGVMARLGVEGQPIQSEPVKVAVLLDEVISAFDPIAEAKGIDLNSVVDKQVIQISADRLALKEVFSNIFENALRYNNNERDGEHRATEIVAEVIKQKENVMVRIADNGKGMSPEQLGILFEKAQRSYVPGQARGTGMGLYLSKLLVELHGGQINVNSNLGQGTEFQITLPLSRAAQ